MGSCCMSFRDLFVLAKSRPWSAEEEQHFRALSQPERNAIVKELAAQAGRVQVEDRRGSDGVVYTAFWVDDAPSKG
jgi:hypothetical protein